MHRRDRRRCYREVLTVGKVLGVLAYQRRSEAADTLM